MKKNHCSLVLGPWPIRQQTAGFTMLEIIMVTGIISLLAGFILLTFPGSQKRARDTQRKSDMKQYQTALETYANKSNGLYPVASGNLSSICGSLGLSGVACPAGSPAYQYRADAGGRRYVMWATLESLAAGGVTQYFVVCSDGLSKEHKTVPTGSNCPL